MNNTALIASGSAHGMDIAGLSSFLAMHLPGDWQALNLEQFVGGQSNPTYRLRAGKTDYVLRKKPAGALAPSAHAIDREFRVMQALAAAGLSQAQMFSSSPSGGSESMQLSGCRNH